MHSYEHPLDWREMHPNFKYYGSSPDKDQIRRLPHVNPQWEAQVRQRELEETLRDAQLKQWARKRRLQNQQPGYEKEIPWHTSSPSRYSERPMDDMNFMQWLMWEMGLNRGEKQFDTELYNMNRNAGRWNNLWPGLQLKMQQDRINNPGVSM